MPGELGQHPVICTGAFQAGQAFSASSSFSRLA
jgi:hypothetical protein